MIRQEQRALHAIRATVGDVGWLTDPEAMAPYLQDSRGRFHGRARAVVQPASTAEVARVVQCCSNAGIGIVPQGGNTGRCGGASPGVDGNEIIVSLARMNRIRNLDPLNYSMTVDAGCVLADIHAAALGAERLFPLSLGAEGSCQIGGNLSTNAGGYNVLRYGNARELTLGLEVVLATGNTWDGLTSLRKDNSGYDIKDLFIGAEGTLGIITGAVLKLFPLPKDVQTAFVALRDLNACIELFRRTRATCGESVTAFELMSRVGLDFALRHIPGCRDPLTDRHDWYVLIVCSGLQPDRGTRDALETVLKLAYDDHVARDAVIAQNETQAQGLWHLREGLVEAQRFEGGSIKHDVSVPLASVPEFVSRANTSVERALPGVRVCAFGHVGDGNIHYNLSQPKEMSMEDFLSQWQTCNRIVHDIVASLGGSFSAEHGVGRLKLGEMAHYKSATELEIMRGIKQMLDPRGIMNAGKVIPDPRPRDSYPRPGS